MSEAQGTVCTRQAPCSGGLAAGPQPIRGQLLCGALLGTLRRETVPWPELGSWDVSGLLGTEVSALARPVLSTGSEHITPRKQ